MSSVPRVDNRYACSFCRHQRRPFFGMPHGDDIGITADGFHRIRNAFPFGGGTALGFGKTNYISTQSVHGCFKTQSGAGGGLKKQRRQYFVLTGFLILFRMFDDIFCFGNEGVDLFRRQVHDINQVSHFTPSIQLSSEGLFRKARRRATSLLWIYPSSAATWAMVSKSVRLTFFTCASESWSRPFCMP